ncbi:MAG TPA: ABC transporter ATP-binding protein [Candidatus Thermoplasmatota archaeon]|nr:ABC transporter ATP-binding protein [Candidatus Thermoplasmatota archaeon]
MTTPPSLHPPSQAAFTRPAVLAMTGVTKEYRMGAETVRALRGVDLRIEQGEFVSIMGPSGSGKSTLLHLMGALDRPTAGTVLVDGHDASEMSDNALARLRGHRIGFVFQSFNLHPMLDALQNVEFPMMAIGVPLEKRRKRAVDLLTQVGLGDRLGHTPSQLSGGQKQRVAIARALANDPAYILADEPTGNLDSKSGAEILGALRYLHRAGKTIVVVTHDPNVAKLTGRTIHILDGRVEAKHQ